MRNQDWYDLGDKVQNLVQDAINSKDFRQLNENITRLIQCFYQIKETLSCCFTKISDIYSGQNDFFSAVHRDVFSPPPQAYKAIHQSGLNNRQKGNLPP